MNSDLPQLMSLEPGLLGSEDNKIVCRVRGVFPTDRVLMYTVVMYRVLMDRVVMYRVLMYRVVMYRVLMYRVVMYRVDMYRVVILRMRACSSQCE